MIKTKVVLIQCYGTMQPPNAEPLSIEMVAGALKQRFGDQIDTELLMLDERDDSDGSNLANLLATRSQLDIIGISVPQSTFFLALGFLNNLQEMHLSPLVVLGHALPTHAPEVFLSSYPNVLIVRGWGETAICDIVEQYRTGSPDWDKVHSIMFIRDGQAVATSVAWPRAIPSPLRVRPHDFFARIESSRGCHYDVCTFCTRQPKARNTPSWFRLPVASVLNEVAHLRAQGITKFTFADEDFVGNDLDGAEEIAHGLRHLSGMQFSLSLRVDNVYNPNESSSLAFRRLNLFRLLKEAGLSLVYFGVESLSDTQLKRYGKGVRAEDSARAVESIGELGIPMELGYILFDPLLTISELQENVYWLTIRSFSRYIGQLFNNLRVQRDSAFVNLLKSRGLLGEFNPNTIEYSYIYQDQTVAEIASICLKWKEEIDEVYALARNIQRTDFSSNACETFVREIRFLELDMLKQLLVSIYLKGSTEINRTFLSNRHSLVHKLKQQIKSSHVTSSATHVLNLSIDHFLEQV